MRGVLVLFGFASWACAGAAPEEPAASPEQPSQTALARPLASNTAGASVSASSCRATPSTVYGSEPVHFALEADARGTVPLELVDQRGRSVIHGATRVPGDWQAPELASGDFRLVIGPNSSVCWVTVNRELARATQPAR